METAINVISLPVFCCLSWNKTTSAHEHRHKEDFFFYIKKLLTQKAKKNADYIARRWSQNAFPYSNLLAARCFVMQWNFSFGTPLFKGHPHLGNTKFGPGKMFT